ncbi:MAG: hypothetical protein L3K26_01940 [Candidatus Hydrogenedentes bacterium]|nr:hypothetical protein [Candidatus Hydrogenedentota bacterium]
MHKITRIAYNSSEWQRPTGDASKSEVSATYNREYGFGHEDWLFRSEWLLDGWRYAYIQGVNKSRTKLLKESLPFDLTLFTIEPDKKRRYVATIAAVECLDDQQAEDGFDEFRERGWYDDMLSEIEDVDGISSNLDNIQRTAEFVLILNVRFRLENVYLYPPEHYAIAADPILKLTRYQLVDADNLGRSSKKDSFHGRRGTSTPPIEKTFERCAIAPVKCTPEHTRMQAKLMEELRVEYPKARVIREQDFIDVSVQTATEKILFEIKSDLDPRTVIRQALGQILEYAFHPNRKHILPVKLVIVGRRELAREDNVYLDRLRKGFGLPISYRVVELSS